MKRKFLFFLVFVSFFSSAFAQYTGTQAKVAIVGGNQNFKPLTSITSAIEFQISGTNFRMDIDPATSQLIFIIANSTGTSLNANLQLDIIFSGGDFGQLNSITKNTGLSTSPGVNNVSAAVLNNTTIRFTNGSTALVNTGNNGTVVWDISASSNALPLKLLSFDAEKKSNAVKLLWQTAEETGFSHFELLRGTNGAPFEKIATIPASGNGASSYTFTDSYPLDPTAVFYKLKMVDLDGTFSYSSIVAVRSNVSSERVEIYPNPVTTLTLQVALPKLVEGKAIIRIMNTSGQEVFIKKYTNPGYAIVIPVDISSLKAGTFLLQVIQGDFNSSQQFIKK